MINYLENNRIFKLILGAGNSNYEEITKLIALYSSVGCRFFDIEASLEALEAYKKGIKNCKDDCFVCISVGANQDPHLTKCKIDVEKCTKCKKCENICLQNALNNCSIDETKCIGCKKCKNICPNDAIVEYQKIKKWEEFLPELFDKVDCIEFHMISDNIDEIDEKWNYLCSNFKGILSICTDRSKLSDENLIKQLKKMIKVANRKIIIQADGNPMTGGKDDYLTTLQAIATADIINKNNIDCFLIMSGGTNSKTSELASLIGVKNNGVAIGSFARKIVKEYVSCSDFLLNKEEFALASKIAKSLIDKI